MRDAFVRALSAIAERDPDTFIITGDLGFGVLSNFAQRFPRQFINAGVAEQNMTGLAAGLALEGKTTFTYSIGNFSTLRCLEQIRNDAAYHHLNVKIVCVGGGFSYGPLGFSHHATEDLAILRALPHLTVVAPGDPVEVELATEAVHRTPGTCYLRLGRGGEPSAHSTPPSFTLGKAIPIHPDGSIALLTTGAILHNVLKARDLLKLRGVEAAVYSVHTLRPLDTETIARLAREKIALVTIEEHSIRGGLGGAVAEVVAELSGLRAHLVRLGLNTDVSTQIGDQEYLRRLHGLSPEQIAHSVLERCSFE